MKLRSLLIFLVSAVASQFVFAQETSVEKPAISELPSLLAIYKDIHSHPELSGHEQRTAALVAKELRAAGCEVTENFGRYEQRRHTEPCRHDNL